MVDIVKVPFQEDEAGCLIDEVRGLKDCNLAVIDMAIARGWTPEDGFPRTSRIRDAYEDDEDYILDVEEGRIDIVDAIQGQDEIVDKATDYLNSIAPEGYIVYWRDGNLFLEKVEEGDYYE